MVDQGPDYSFKQSPVFGQIIDASQRSAQLQQQALQNGQQLFTQGMAAIGALGKSIADRRKSMAQAMTVKKQFGIEDPSNALDADQALKIASMNNKIPDLFQSMIVANPALAKDPDFVELVKAHSPKSPQVASQPETAASNVSAMPSQPITAGIGTPPMSSFTPPPTTSTGTVQGAGAPAIPDMISKLLSKPMSGATATMAAKMAAANKPENVLQYDPANGLLTKVGEKNKGDQVITTQPKTQKDLLDPKYQGKLEKQYQDMKLKVLSNRSGGLGLENQKVDQGIHLRKAINQYYDPKTDTYNIPPSLHSEFVVGLARLMSPSGVVAQQTMDDLRQKTAREGAANVLISMGFDPKDVGGTTQSVAKFFVEQIDRQAQTAEENRDGYMNFLHGQAPTDLDPSRIAKHDKVGLNSFNDILSKSPDKLKASGGLSPDEQAFIQAYEAKHGITK